MPALMAKRASSKRCAIRRELHRCRNLAAPKGGIAKKSSTKQSSASIHNSSADEPVGPAAKNPPSMTTPRPQAGVATLPASNLQHASKMKVSAVQRVSGVSSKSASPCPSDSSGADNTTELSGTAGAAYIKNMPTIPARPRFPSIRVKKGMTVKVRTRAGVLPTGHCLVLWLAARVVSDAAADDGFLDVMYNGNFPRDDPSRTVRVAMHDVRSMPTTGES